MKPEIRFKGFSGEWEVIKADDIFRTFNERNRPDLPVLSATQDKGMITRDSYGYKISHDKSNEVTYKHILPGQFVIHLRSFQGGFAHSAIEGIASPAYTVFEFKNKEHHHDYFWRYIFMSKSFIKRLELITYGIRDGRSISYDEFKEMSFVVPTKNEQIEIAEHLIKMDTQITSSEARLASLKQVKAASLQGMFPQDGESVPRVRFKGFDGEWRKVKLNSFAKRVTRKNNHLESTLALTIASAYGLVSQIEYFNNLVVGANISNYYLLKKGEFAYNKSYSNGYPFGSVKRLDRYEQGILSTLYIVFCIDDSISSDYLTHYFDTTLWHKGVSENAAEGARNHGLLNISAEDFLKIDILMPESKAEQQKIADYFTTLDRQIDLETQRIEKLRQIKSAFLDKMFV